MQIKLYSSVENIDIITIYHILTCNVWNLNTNAYNANNLSNSKILFCNSVIKIITNSYTISMVMNNQIKKRARNLFDIFTPFLRGISRKILKIINNNFYYLVGCIIQKRNYTLVRKLQALWSLPDLLQLWWYQPKLLFLQIGKRQFCFFDYCK